MGSIVLYLGSTLNKGMIRAEKAVLTGTRFGHSGAPELPRYRMQTEKSINGKFSEPSDFFCATQSNTFRKPGGLLGFARFRIG